MEESKKKDGLEKRKGKGRKRLLFKATSNVTKTEENKKKKEIKKERQA